MKSLLLVAHGSDREASNDEVRSLARLVAGRAGARFDRVECAFLKTAKPSVGEAVDACVSRGIDEIIMVPHFLSAGTHVVRDIPDLIAAKRKQHPAVEFTLVPHVGAAAGMDGLILALADHHGMRAG